MPDDHVNNSAVNEPVQAAAAPRLERKASGELLAHIDGQGAPLEDVRVARCFPWSVSDCYISVRSKEGKEVALIRDLEALDDASRRIVLEELRDKVFNPKILSISHCKREFDVTRITAQTDRGEVTFQLRTRDDVRVLSEGRALFRDVDGNTYELADLQQLDPSSRKHLSEFF